MRAKGFREKHSRCSSRKHPAEQLNIIGCETSGEALLCNIGSFLYGSFKTIRQFSYAQFIRKTAGNDL